MTDSDLTDLLADNPEYRQNEEPNPDPDRRLRKHPNLREFRAAQTQLWKTPDYRLIHRRYSGRLKELNKAYGSIVGSD